MFKHVVHLLCVLLLSSPALAHPPEPTLPEVVVTASKWDEPGEDVTQSMTVITRKEIEKRGVSFVADLLRTESDLSIVQNGGFGKNASLFLRGGDGKQVLVLVDGVTVNSPSTGAADLSGLMTDDIERVEIIKGPQSTLYGSEAMAGVVNIITKKGTGKLKGSVAAEGGSFGTVKTSGTLSGSTDLWDYRLTATFFDTDGISAAKSGTEPDGYTNTAVSARIGFTPSDRSSLGLNLRYGHDRSALDGFTYGVGLVDDPNWVQTRDDYLVSVSGMVFPLDTYGQALTLSLTGVRLRSEDPDTPWNNAQIDTSTRLVDWRHTLDLAPFTVTAGFAYRREAAENRGGYDESVDTKAGYLSGKARLFDASLIVDGGVRYDAHETFGNNLTWRAGVLYHLKPWGVRLKANHGTGFRAPSLNELFYPNYGTRDLKPEKSTAFDAGIEKEFLDGRLVVGATWFRQRYRNLIQTNFATFMADNIGRARCEGVETVVSAQPLEGLTLRAAYTYLEAVDLETDRLLSRRPRNRVTSSLEYTVASLTLAADYLYVSKRFDASARRDLSPHSLVNLRGSYEVNRHVRLYARVDDLFDTDYEEAGGYNAPGIAAFGGIEVRMP